MPLPFLLSAVLAFSMQHFSLANEKLTLTKEKISEIICAPQPSFNKLCEASRKVCSQFDNYRNCHATSDEAFFRKKNKKLKQEAFDKARNFFKSIVSDPNLQNFCGDRFKKTELIIVRGSEESTEYVTKYNIVQISEDRLVNSYTEEGIERTILHELGHACQYNRNPAGIDNECDSKYSNIRDYNIILSMRKTDLEKIMSPDEYRCIEKMFAQKKSNCKIPHLMEMYANLVFVEKKSKIAHWSWDCGAIETKYNPTAEYQDCFIKSQRAKDRFCKTATLAGKTKKPKALR